MDIDKLNKLNFKLVVGGNTWVLNNWGVVGLSPKGSFINYVSEAYG